METTVEVQVLGFILKTQSRYLVAAVHEHWVVCFMVRQNGEGLDTICWKDWVPSALRFQHIQLSEADVLRLYIESNLFNWMTRDLLFCQ